MTADQKRMWMEWARGLESLGSGPRPALRMQHTAMPCRKLPVRQPEPAPAPRRVAPWPPEDSA